MLRERNFKNFLILPIQKVYSVTLQLKRNIPKTCMHMASSKKKEVSLRKSGNSSDYGD